MRTLTQRRKSLRMFSLGDKDNLVIRIVLINLIVFAGLFLVKIIFQVTNATHGFHESQILSWVLLSADSQQLVTHPWTLLSYMFVHANFWLLLSCMIWFWGYGTLVQGLYGSRLILPLYILGGLAGAVTFFAAFQMIPGMVPYRATATSIRIGASASVMAIIACVTFLVPKYKIFPMLAGGFPLYILSIIYVVFCFVGKGGSLLYGYLAANTGGLLLGLYFGYRIKNGYQPGEFINHIIYQFSHAFEPKKEEITQKQRYQSMDELTTAYKARESSAYEESVDEILDKINTSGYDSLTPEEKEILVKASKED